MAARLRHTFHYPSDDDEDEALASTEVLDEQEQENLITKLATENRQRNTSFLRLLYVLPALSSIPFLLGLLLPPTSSSPTTTNASHHPILCLLSLSSLLATGWLLFRQEVTETGFSFLDQTRTTAALFPHSKPTASESSSDASPGGGYSYGYGLSPKPFIQKPRSPAGILGTNPPLLVINHHQGGGGGGTNKSPLELHLPRLNLALASLSLLTGILERGDQVSSSITTGGVNPLLLGALPGVVYGSVVGAKVVMAGVDPERELSGLKYAYKGA
ncbi:hypothetical protein N657DRAFT_691147 [Parathielavia appendiculata]|uniref:Uncharacterized protein n=1 Tax=Parathielavia appendiculata TaxID=2587402 RepID=A0AAN6Z203_9PEZI|nr:hypothetical protein N657DRAFT_691147 [Parathielavia appendiculata]